MLQQSFKASPCSQTHIDNHPQQTVIIREEGIVRITNNNDNNNDNNHESSFHKRDWFLQGHGSEHAASFAARTHTRQTLLSDYLPYIFRSVAIKGSTRNLDRNTWNSATICRVWQQGMSFVYVSGFDWISLGLSRKRIAFTWEKGVIISVLGIIISFFPGN